MGHQMVYAIVDNYCSDLSSKGKSKVNIGLKDLSRVLKYQQCRG